MNTAREVDKVRMKNKPGVCIYTDSDHGHQPFPQCLDGTEWETRLMHFS